MIYAARQLSVINLTIIIYSLFQYYKNRNNPFICPDCNFDLNEYRLMKLDRTQIRFYAITTFILFSWILRGQGHYVIDDRAKGIYSTLLELKLDQATREIHQAKAADPNNLFLLHLENYVDFFTLFIGEEEEVFDRLEKNKEARLKILKKGDTKDPYHRLVQAEILLQWAIVRLKFGEYFTAVRETQRAHQLLMENQELFPGFIPNNKGLAMIHAVIGTIPDTYRYLVEWFTGMEGSIRASLKEVDELIAFCEKEDHIFSQEAYVIKALIVMNFENDPEKAWKIIQQAGLDPANSPTAGFILSNIARRAGLTDEAIRILSRIQRKKEQYPFYFLDFMLGLNKLHRLDPDAGVYLERYVTHFRGQNYLKEAYQLLAWHSLVSANDPRKAREYYRLCRQHGNLLVDEDKSAHKEALDASLPDPLLLKIRLLFDGGYYLRSLRLLQDHRDQILPSAPMEYYYRTARNQQLLGQEAEALSAYRKVLDMPEADKSFQKCNAALQSGIIHEQSGRIKEAETLFNLCLSLDPDEYKNSLHQKAKAGLDRLK